MFWIESHNLSCSVNYIELTKRQAIMADIQSRRSILGAQTSATSSLSGVQQSSNAVTMKQIYPLQMLWIVSFAMPDISWKFHKKVMRFP